MLAKKRALRLSNGQKFGLQNMIKIINNLEEVNFGLILGPKKPSAPNLGAIALVLLSLYEHTPLKSLAL